MESNRWFLVILAIYLLGYFSHALYLKKTVYGDGIFYYSWVRSAVVDHDFDFRNEYAHFGAVQPLARHGLTGNKYAVGPAILWAPAFLLLNSIIKGTGYEFSYQLAIGLTSVLYGIFGLILLYRLLSKFFSREISQLTILTVALATNLFYYGSLDPVNSHVVSFFAVIVFLTFLLDKKKNWLIVGLTLGLVGLIRPQDLVIGLAALPFLKPKSFIPLFLGVVTGFLPQLIAWQSLYGKFWQSPYLMGSEGFDFLRPHFFEVLFAPWYGLFTFTPILLLGFFGLILWKSKLKIVVCLAVLLELLLISSWSIWWQGAAVGGRMFVASIPLFALGLGQIFNRLKKHGWNWNIYLFTLIMPLSLLNIVLTFSYLLLH